MQKRRSYKADTAAPKKEDCTAAYGLKFSSGFRDTHLARIGKS